MGSWRSLLAVLLVIVMVAPVAASALPASSARPGANSDAWMLKFHPALLAKVLNGEISDDDVVTVVFRLQPIPSYTWAVAKGHHDMMVSALKSWARQTQAQFIAEVYKHGGTVLNTFWIDNVVLVRARMGVIKELANNPLVVKVFENFRVHLIQPVHEQTLSVRPGEEISSWGIFRIGAPEAWDMGYTGEGVRIAVLDTGVDVTHPALEGKMLTLDPDSPYYPGGWMEFDENGNPVLSQPHDTHGHGTHVSGTALGGDMENILIGVAPGATLMHGLVLQGGSGTFAEVLAGIQWAVDPFYIDPDTGELVPTGLPAHVISMSLGASGYYGDDLFPGIEAALASNIVVVAAIGNDGPDTSSNPGNIWGVFGVGATDQDDEVAWFSSGEVVEWPNPPSEWPFFGYYPSQYIKPDFAAPGVAITSSVPGGGYATWDGTSMATPHVAGTVALVLQAAGWNEEPVPDTPEMVYMILKNTSLDLGDPGQDTRYGWGLINASAAVKLALKYAKKTGVKGVVLDSTDYSPVKWAKIYVQETGKTYGVTSNGSFRIPLDPGTYHLTFTAWGYYNKTVVVNVTVENGTIIGYVFDALTQAPIAGAEVTVVEANITTYTNSSGFFQVTVPAGSYTLEVSASGYHTYETSVTVQENQTLVIQIPLQPAGYGTIKGYVVDASTGDPIQGAYVVVDENPNFTAVTDANGYYEIANIPAGTHVVEAFAQGYSRGYANVTLLPNETVWANFSLAPLPPAIAVVGNYKGHVYQLLAEYFNGTGIQVANYTDARSLLEDWLNGMINPATIVIDHWNANTSRPSWPVVAALLYLTNATGVPLVLLDTPYDGYTAAKALYYYNENVSAMGFPAPEDYIDDFPDPHYVLVQMLDPNDTIFAGVVPDNDSYFYLADLNESSYADYIFFVNWSQPIYFVGAINDTYNNETGGAVGYWMSPGGSLWIILSSWAESGWMQYTTPGSDGMYSANTQKVLLNAVTIAVTYFLNLNVPAKPLALEHARSMLGLAKPVKPNKYVNITVYLDRLPYGYVEGTLVGSDGFVLSNATIKVVGTPVEVTADASGYFKTWLPAGNYTLEIYKPGYARTYVNVTVNVNETTNLGKLTIHRVPRIAILYDYNGELKGLIEEYLGWYAEDFDNATDFAAALRDPFFDAGIWAGYYYAPMPSLDQFMDVWSAINETGKSVIFMDQWDYASRYPQIFGYGIRALNEYLGDPASRFSDDYFGDIYIKITRYSPIFHGYQVGQVVKIINYNTQGYGTDYSYFKGFTGETLATLLLGGTTEVGDAIAYKVLDNGAKIVLMASWAPEEYQDIQWWTDDMVKIFINAVIWVAAKPINVTPSLVEAYVGDTVNFSLSGLPANYTVYVYMDGEQIATITSGPNGTATFTYHIPAIPGGTHLFEFIGAQQDYYGAAKLIIKAKISLPTTNITAPTSLGINVTGLYSNEIVHIYIDGNYLGTAKASENGVLTTIINVPMDINGTHCLKIVAENYTVRAKTKIHVTSTLETLIYNTRELMDMLSKTNATLQAIMAKGDEIYALINTTKGQIMVKLGDVHTLVTTKYSQLESLVKSVNGSLAGLIKTESGDLYALINTSTGKILAKIDDSTSAIQNSIDTAKKDVLARIDSLQQSLQQTIQNTTTSLKQEISSAKSRANTGAAVGGVALITGLASLGLIFRGGRLEG